MTHRPSLLVAMCVALASPLRANDGAVPSTARRFWPAWRGPLATGVAPQASPPVRWGERRNVRWRVALPGRGHSTPIVWEDHVFVTCAIPHGERLEPRAETAPGAHDNAPVTHRQLFVVLALRRSDGRLAWERTVHEGLPHEGGHVSGTFASASPVTDGERVLAFFGSRGLYCLDLDGKLTWSVDLGDMQTKHGHGEGASPVLHGDTVVVNWDHEGQSFVVALDKRTGAERWRRARDEVTSWATPVVVEHGGDTQLVVSGTGRVRGYDLATGDLVWQCGGLSGNVVASPVSAGGMVFAGSSYDTQAMLALRIEGAHGDITHSEHVVWTRHRRTPYVPSPLLYGDTLYFLRHYQGILYAVEASSGRERSTPLRLPGIRNVYASPVGAAGRVYVTDRSGTTVVVRHGDDPEVLAINRLDDSVSASAAVVDSEIYLRGERFLWCLGVNDPHTED